MKTLSTLDILPANNTDIDTLSQLVNSAYRGDSSKKGWTTEADLLDGQRTDQNKILEMIQSPNSVVLKAIEDQQLVGCVYLEKYHGDCYLGMLTIKPTLQNSGLGKKLLQAAEDYAIKNFKSKNMLMTVISERLELIEWYKRRGYQFTGEKKPFPMDDPRFGIPKVKRLEFIVLRKNLI